MRKFWKIMGLAAGGLVVLFALAGRNLAELTGLVRASADVTVDGVTDQLPREVHDRKLNHDLAQVRQEVIDRQVQLSLSKNQLDQLRTDVRDLRASTERRQPSLKCAPHWTTRNRKSPFFAAAASKRKWKARHWTWSRP